MVLLSGFLTALIKQASQSALVLVSLSNMKHVAIIAVYSIEVSGELDEVPQTLLYSKSQHPGGQSDLNSNLNIVPPFNFFCSAFISSVTEDGNKIT